MMKKQSNSTGVAVLLILASTFGFSLYPILGKVVFGGGAGLATVLFVRFTIAALIFWVITIWREGFPRIPLKTWLVLWGMGGIGYAMMAGLYISSVLYIPASLSALLLYVYPMIVTVISVLTKQEKFSIYKLAGLLIASFGLILVLGLALQGINYIGILLALSAALVYAIYILVGNKMLKTTTPLVSNSIIATSAAFTYGIVGLPLGGTTWNLSWSTWLGIGGIILFSTILAMLTFFEGIKRLGPTSSSIISTTEPVMTVILAVVLFNENITLLQAVGGIFVILGGILAILFPTSRVIKQTDISAPS